LQKGNGRMDTLKP